VSIVAPDAQAAFGRACALALALHVAVRRAGKGLVSGAGFARLA